MFSPAFSFHDVNYVMFAVFFNDNGCAMRVYSLIESISVDQYDR